MGLVDANNRLPTMLSECAAIGDRDVRGLVTQGSFDLDQKSSLSHATFANYQDGGRCTCGNATLEHFEKIFSSVLPSV